LFQSLLWRENRSVVLEGKETHMASGITDELATWGADAMNLDVVVLHVNRELGTAVVVAFQRPGRRVFGFCWHWGLRCQQS